MGGEVVVLATPWNAAQDALRSCGNLKGKILLDCTNPLKADLSGLEVGHTTSGSEQVAAWSEGARVVKILIQLKKSQKAAKGYLCVI